MKTPTLISALFLAISTQSHSIEGEITKPKTELKDNSLTVVVKEGRVIAYSGLSNPLVLNSKLRLSSPKTFDEALKTFGPAFINSDSGMGICEWRFSDNKCLSCSFPTSFFDKLVDLNKKIFKTTQRTKMQNKPQ